MLTRAECTEEARGLTATPLSHTGGEASAAEVGGEW